MPYVKYSDEIKAYLLDTTGYEPRWKKEKRLALERTMEKRRERLDKMESSYKKSLLLEKLAKNKSNVNPYILKEEFIEANNPDTFVSLSDISILCPCEFCILYRQVSF